MNTNPVDANILSSGVKPTEITETPEVSASGVLAIERGDTRVVLPASNSGPFLRSSSDKVNDISDPPNLQQIPQHGRTLALEGKNPSLQTAEFDDEDFLGADAGTELENDLNISPPSSPRIIREQKETTTIISKTGNIIQNALQPDSELKDGRKIETLEQHVQEKQEQQNLVPNREEPPQVEVKELQSQPQVQQPDQAQVQLQPQVVQPQPQPQLQQPLAQVSSFAGIRDGFQPAPNQSTQSVLGGLLDSFRELGKGKTKLQADLARNPDGSYKLEPFTVAQAPGKIFYKIEATYTVSLKDNHGNIKMDNGQPMKIELKRYIYTDATDPKDALFLAGTYQDFVVKNAKGKTDRLVNFPEESEKKEAIKNQQSFRLFFKSDSRNHPTSLTSIQVNVKDANNQFIQLKPRPVVSSNKKYVRNLFKDQQIAKRQEDSGNVGIGKVVYQTKEELLRYAPYTVSDPGIYARFASDPSKLDELHKKIAEKEKEFEELQKEFKEKRYFGMGVGKESAKYQQFLVDTKAYEAFRKGENIPNVEALSPNLQALIKTKEKLKELVGEKNPGEVLREIKDFAQTLQTNPAAKMPDGLAMVFSKQTTAKTEDLLGKFIKETETDLQALHISPTTEHTKMITQLQDLQKVAKSREFKGYIPPKYARQHPGYSETIKKFNEYVLSVKVKALKDTLKAKIKELAQHETTFAKRQVAFNEQLMHLQDVNRELGALTQELKDVKKGARDAIGLATALPEDQATARKIDAKIPDKRIAELERNNGAHTTFIKNIVFELKALGVDPSSAPPDGAVRDFVLAEDFDDIFQY